MDVSEEHGPDYLIHMAISIDEDGIAIMTKAGNVIGNDHHVIADDMEKAHITLVILPDDT